MKKMDFIFSLGPSCRNTWNLRNYFGIERAYPFDWWITPAKSMLRMIESGFHFHVDLADLYITPTNEHNTVYNHKYNIMHHHDFPRRGPKEVVLSITDKDIQNINSKYKKLFERLFEDVRNASNPVAVLDGNFSGWPDAYKEVRDRLAKKLRLLFIFISNKEEKIEEHEWGWIICLPDLGTRENLKDADLHHAEPIHVFRQAYRQLGFSSQIEAIKNIKSLLEWGKLEDANICIEQVCKICPDSADLIKLQGELMVRKGNLQKAEKIFSDVIIRWPNDLEALNSLGVCMIYKNDFDAGIKLFSKILEIDPSNTVAIENLKFIKKEMKDKS
jgi:tetratricopeptide (TPR) repeat protein